MEIKDSYKGPKFVVVTERKGLYHFTVADSSKELDDAINGIRDPNIIARYDGVNDDSLILIDKATRDLDAGDQVDLAKLLS